MTCLACRNVGRSLCPSCRRQIRPSPPSVTPAGLPVRSWLIHDGPARVLAHRLKYEAVASVATLAAAGLESMVPPDAEALVPVPRVLVRRVRYGVDPAFEVASALSRRTGIPVEAALRAPVWQSPSAGADRRRRTGSRFSGRRGVRGAVLVDDVVTTGRTLDRAAAALGGALAAVTVTGVP